VAETVQSVQTVAGVASGRKAYLEKLKPTPQQERQLAAILWRCRTRYHSALQPRITRWRQRGVSRTRSGQEAELKDLRAELWEDADTHRHLWPDVLARLEKTSHACFRRVQHAAKPGCPRLHGRNRSRAVPAKASGNGARRENGALRVRTIGRLAVRWSRPIQGTNKTVTISREADGWYVWCSGAEVPTEPLP